MSSAAEGNQCPGSVAEVSHLDPAASPPPLIMPRPLSETARQKAIDATMAILATEGMDGFSVEAVCRSSGVAKTTLYRHWASGNELLVDALDCHIVTVDPPDTGNLTDDLMALMSTAVLVMGDPSRRQLLLDLLGAATRDPELQRINEAMMAERTQPITAIIERAVERGEIPSVDLQQAMDFVHGPLMARTLVHGQPPDASELPSLVAMIVRGLGGTPPND